MMDVHFSSKTGDWSTPQDLFDELNATFRFTLDACASAENAKCEKYFTAEDNALHQEWGGTVWMNPPYGRAIGGFMFKALQSSRQDGATVVCLVPARTDTAWWHNYAKHGTIIYLRGRLKFGGSKTSAPFPSAIVIFWGGTLGKAIA